MKEVADQAVETVFEEYPAGVRRRLAALRTLILDVAARTEGVGRLTETLKWGQPSYLTEETGSGSTVRIDRHRESDGCAVYFHCRSGLVEDFRTLYPKTFRYEGKRAIVFDAGDRLPEAELRHCLALALTHHLRKKKRAS
ncbi:MAG: DUF1801 domain-containing protein [Proteobacteria bacterium]|nr:DUF1801 domain-containing protein [Pseudomonadota bacterium]